MTTPASHTQRPSRRWLRYSLRTLLVVLLVLSVALAYRANKIARREAAIAAIRAAGGSVYTEGEYAEQVMGITNYQPPRLPPLETLWRFLAGDLGAPDTALLSGPDITDELLATHVVRLRSLTFLHMDDVAVTDEGLQCLAPLTSLKWLICLRNSDNAAVVVALRATTSAIDFIDADLPFILQFINDAWQPEVAFEIDEAELARAGINQNSVFTAQADNVTLAEALDAILAPHGLGWLVGDERIVITSAAKAREMRAPIEELRGALPQLEVIDVD